MASDNDDWGPARDASYRCSTSDSKAGSLVANLPEYCSKPPIEAVVFGWGVTEDGQLGMDSLEDVMRPSVIESLLGTHFSGFQFNRMPIVAGSRNTLALTQSGRVLSFGWNDRGTLGIGHRRSMTKPTLVSGLAHEHIAQVAIGGWHCMAVTSQGQVYTWGGNEYFQCGVDAGKHNIMVPKLAVPFLRVRAVSCGGMHSLALTTTGEVWQWGEPWGDFSMEINRSPKKLRIAGVDSISAGAFHNLALTSEGRVYGWGTNDFGQLGTGDTAYATEPRQAVGLDDIAVADIDAGGWHSLALTCSGAVYTWGRGEYGRLGLNDPKGTARTRPCRVPRLAEHIVVQAACGGSHTMVLTDKGKMFIWGRHSFGRLGMDCDHTVEAPVEVHLPGGSDRWQPICIAVGGRHSMCMALPRHTIDDHERRRTADQPLVDAVLGRESSGRWLGSGSYDGRATPVWHRASSSLSGRDGLDEPMRRAKDDNQATYRQPGGLPRHGSSASLLATAVQQQLAVDEASVAPPATRSAAGAADASAKRHRPRGVKPRPEAAAGSRRFQAAASPRVISIASPGLSHRDSTLSDELPDFGDESRSTLTLDGSARSSRKTTADCDEVPSAAPQDPSRSIVGELHDHPHPRRNGHSAFGTVAHTSALSASLSAHSNGAHRAVALAQGADAPAQPSAAPSQGLSFPSVASPSPETPRLQDARSRSAFATRSPPQAVRLGAESDGVDADAPPELGDGEDFRQPRAAEARSAGVQGPGRSGESVGSELSGLGTATELGGAGLPNRTALEARLDAAVSPVDRSPSHMVDDLKGDSDLEIEEQEHHLRIKSESLSRHRNSHLL